MQKSSKVFTMTKPAVIPYSQDNYAYVIHLDRTTLVVDPGEKSPIQKFLQENSLELTHILITHPHPDHLGGAVALQKKWDCALLGPACKQLPALDQSLLGNDELVIGPLSFQVLATPGHTAHDLCFYFPKEKWLFSGDTLFHAGCGKVFSGTYHQLYQSLSKIKKLPDETQVFPGHAYVIPNLEFALSLEPKSQKLKQVLQEAKDRKNPFPTTLGWEKEYNPFLSVEDKKWHKIFSTSDPLSVFTSMRKLKDQFKGAL